MTIPDNVTSVPDYAFANCAHLSTVIIGNSVTSIGAGAFQRLVSLTTVVISDSVTFIDSYAFSWCTNLVSIVFPNSVTQTGTLIHPQAARCQQPRCLGNHQDARGRACFVSCAP